MTIGKKLTLSLAGAAVALSTFAAAPARADDQQLIGLLAGIAAIAIVANAAQADRPPARVEVRRDIHPAPAPRRFDHAPRDWHGQRNFDRARWDRHDRARWDRHADWNQPSRGHDRGFGGRFAPQANWSRH